MLQFYKDLSNLLEAISVKPCFSCSFILLMSGVTLRLASQQQSFQLRSV